MLLKQTTRVGQVDPVSVWPKLRERIILISQKLWDYDRKIPAKKREETRLRRQDAKEARLDRDAMRERVSHAKVEVRRRIREENQRIAAFSSLPGHEPQNAVERLLPSVLAGMTEKQAGEALGIELFAISKNWISDGELDEEELSKLRMWLSGIPDKAVPAIRFLKEEIKEVIADGLIEEHELERVHRAMIRVLPSRERAAAKSAITNRKRNERERVLREMDRDRREYWAAQRHSKKRIWQSQPATEAQIEYLLDLGGKPVRGMSQYDASILIDKILGND